MSAINQAVGLAVLLPLASCGPRAKPKVCMELMHIPHSMQIRSSAFKNGGPIPLANTGYGQDISPELSWSGVPANAKSLVLIVEDPDASGGTFTHWTVYAMKPTLRSLPAGLASDRGEIPYGAQGTNGADGLGYFGPKPPDDKPHHYHFQIIALKAMLRSRPGIPISTIYPAVHDYAICGGDLVGVFTKPK